MATRLKIETVAAETPNPVRQFTELELRGKTYQLCYDHESIMIAEELAGCEVQDAISEWIVVEEVKGAKGMEKQFRLDTKKVRSRTLAAMFFAALRVAQPEITFEASMRLINPVARVTIIGALVEAWGVSDRDPTEPANKSGVSPGAKVEAVSE